ncbi:MAG TPA: type II secretion system protein GspJ [Verrucomicrobiae bacterium]|nr:type II secretion system protein GspJ [Verrucomicrobiae bacterium]
MNTASKQNRNSGAFTLIELLLAVAIAAVVLIAINSVLFGAIHLRAKTMEATEQTLPMDRAVATLKQDLLCILQPGTNGSNTIVGPMGTDATGVGLTQTPLLEIYTASGTVGDDVPWGSIQKIDYWLQPSTNRNGPLGQDLVRGVTRNLLPTTATPPEQQQVLLQNVQRLQLSFFDGTNWNDTWSTTLTNVPVAIKGAISFAKPRPGGMMSLPVQFLVPIVAWANSTNTALTNITTGL